MLDKPYMHYKTLNMLYITMQCKGQHKLIFSEVTKIKNIELIPQSTKSHLIQQFSEDIRQLILGPYTF